MTEDSARDERPRGPIGARPIKNVVFDFGGVIVNWRPQDVVSAMFDRAELRAAILHSVLRHADWLELDRGTLAEPEAIARFAARTGIDAPAIAELMNRLRHSLTLNIETAALVQAIAASGMPVYGLSNMPAPTFAFLKSRYDVWSRFDGIVISGEIGLVKPEPQIFEHLLATYDLDEAETIFIDDHEPNIAAAGRLGFQTMLFREGAACIDELRRRLGMD